MFDNLTGVSGAKAADVLSNNSLAQNRLKADLRKKFGERLRDARELNGLDQAQAAKRLGYKTTSQVSQWEHAKRMPPTEHILLASQVYRVSIDYLFGVSDEPDRDPVAAERRLLVEVNRHLFAKLTEAMADELIKHTRRAGPSLQAALLMIDEGQALVAALNRFVELNKDAFEEDMRGGSNVLQAAESFEVNGLRAGREALERHQRVSAEAFRQAKKVLDNQPDPSTASLFDYSQA